jgi:serine/threonine protein kinase/Tol biopolymer transport system component
MSLASGTKLGPYEIQSPLGAGGMGEVYRARDTRLDRTVAIKILPSHLSDNPEARQRFDREARAISSLNHPNICTLHDVGHQDGVDYLVMEYLDGETLADRLVKGPLPAPQVLQYGIEICEGLEKAHRSGVVHRDLKPGNVMLTKTGAKLMDFGLAKAVTVENPPSSGLTATLLSPAGSHPLTAQGTVVGTFQYMSPEQVEGKEADLRGDIFALGAVLYEMVTGRPAFSGKSQASIVAAILASDPQPISAIQPMSPPALDRVVKNCLAKDPEDRFQSVHDLKLQLKWIAEGGSQAGIPSPVTTHRKNRERLAWVAVLALMVIGAVLMRVWPGQPDSSNRAIQSYLPAPENATFILSDDDTAGPVVISPNGTYVAFVAIEKDGTKRIWVRALSGAAATPLAGSEGGTYPFWSPDEKWLGFFADGKMKKTPMNGGPALVLANAPRARGGSWGENGVILFAPTPLTGLSEVAAAGGTAQPVTKLTQGVHTTHRWPVWLPGGKRFLYLATNHESPAASERNGIYVATLDGSENRFLMPADSNVVLTPGHLLSVQNGTLMAQPFDVRRAELQGDALPVAESVIRNAGTWRAAFDASQDGILVYQAGSSVFGSQLLWMAHDSKPPTQLGETSKFGEMRLSPDGRKLAVVIGEPTSALWIYDVTRGVRTRFTFESTLTDATPVWSPDGNRIAFSQRRGGGLDIYVKDASGSGKEELLFSDNQDKPLSDWSPDGRYLMYTSTSLGQASSIWLLPLSGDRKPQVFLEGTGQFLQGAGQGLMGGGVFSPDGKWVAYASRESGRSEVYLSNFPQASGKWQVSTSGGGQPRWRRDGKALLYLGIDRTLMEAPITVHGDVVEIGEVHPYVKTNAITLRYGGVYDLAADGRVLVNSTMGEDTRTITMVVNWTAGLKK